MKVNIKKNELLMNLRTRFGNVVTRKQVVSFLKETNNTYTPNWLFNNEAVRMSRGVYNLDLVTQGIPEGQPTPENVATGQQTA